MRSRLWEDIREKHIIIALVALTLAVFGPFVGNAFVSLDDNYLIYQNAAVQHFGWSSLVHVFTSYDPQLYIPLTFLSFQINAALFGMNATAFHIVNLLLHCGNVVLVFLIIRRLSKNLFVAGVTAALFAIHPIQTEAVLWAASRKDLLSGLFFLLATLSYLRYRDADWRRVHLSWSIAFYALALLSKVSVILLPLWLVMIDWLQKREGEKRIITEKVPFVGLAAVFAVVAVVGKSRILQSSGTLLNVLLPMRSMTFYLEKFVWPFGLSVIYPYSGNGQQLFADFGASILVAVLLLGLLVFLVLQMKHRLAAFALGTYVVLLAPSFTTFWKNGLLYVASDRYVYLASIGIFLLAALALQRLRQILRHRGLTDTPVVVCTGVLLLALIPMTLAQGGVWSDSEALYRNVVRLYPDSVMAQTNFGLELQHKKKFEEARQHYERAIDIDPRWVHAYFNLSSLNTEEGKTEEADRVMLRIVDAFGAEQVQSPSDLRPFLWLVGKLDSIGRPDEAVRLLKKLVLLAPQFPEPLEILQKRESVR